MTPRTRDPITSTSSFGHDRGASLEKALRALCQELAALRVQIATLERAQRSLLLLALSQLEEAEGAALEGGTVRGHTRSRHRRHSEDPPAHPIAAAHAPQWKRRAYTSDRVRT